jgi:hypothetical protein
MANEHLRLFSARYGATVVHLRRIFFPRSLVGDGSPGGRRGDSAQMWRICAVFFSFFLSFPVDASCRTYANHAHFSTAGGGTPRMGEGVLLSSPTYSFYYT